MLRKFALAFAMMVPVAAAANDTTAELQAGGLIFVRNDAISIDAEDLFISPDEVRVTYQFGNNTDEDVESLVAFPMPDITPHPYSEVAIPEHGADNFLGFTVDAGGAAITPSLEQKAFAAELDVTEELRERGMPLNPYAEGVDAALEALPDAVKQDWVSRGLLVVEAYDDGSGMKSSYFPVWRLKSTYWWRMTFPAGRPLKVNHTYKPSVGGTAGIGFMEDGAVGGPYAEEYRQKYCMDESFERAVNKAAQQNPDGYPRYTERWLSYVLTTGANWARSSIGTFTLTVDKGSPKNLVSFCGEGVTKIGPTTFRMVANDFYPMRDLNILILRPYDY